MSDFGSIVMIVLAGYSLLVAIFCCGSASCDFYLAVKRCTRPG
jgi:hypothetical protein